ncbi:MAG: tRNA dihydrouridine synthase DusB [Flavobacteriales bacterium]|nr:tRNA dihydrouridine synthase DusB [Flavobacteriales bacterium]|tara:strand:+ start:5676 stop:6653 length:978 start_codon:yes stop_codon:yes gene_type:complete
MVKIGDIELGEFPILLAPMEDVSDPPFRKICKRFGVDLMYTEFISSEGLIRDAVKSTKKLDIFNFERPIGVQIFGGNEDSMKRAVEIVSEVKPDIIDINFGCPVKKVTCKGAGAGILQDIPKMVKLTKSIVNSTSIPVTVKTRLGWDEKSMYIVEVAEKLQDVGIKAISIHGRTRKQMYKGCANWTLIEKTKENPRLNIPVFGNGDVFSAHDVKEKKDLSNVDGVMIGRGSIGNPWIFNEINSYIKNGILPPPPTIKERIDVVKEHLDLSIKWKGEKLGVLEMRRHYTNYFKGFKGIKNFRIKLVTSNNVDEISDTLQEIDDHFN